MKLSLGGATENRGASSFLQCAAGSAKHGRALRPTALHYVTKSAKIRRIFKPNQKIPSTLLQCNTADP
jgi:hypothetical protein